MAVLVLPLMFSVKFRDANGALAQASVAVPMAEAHGCLCGALCAAYDYPFVRWSEELFDGREEAGGEAGIARDILQHLYTETVRALRGDEMTFSLFLPDDDAPLSLRAEALAQWCQGFLYGFGSIAGAERPKLTGDVDEVLRDLSQIARASAGENEPTEEDEADYTEIVEYLRAGVQLVHDELRPTLQ